MGKTLPPSVVFAINEGNMTTAFWDYMNHMISENSPDKMHRAHTIAELEAIVARI
ncbi:MAG: hypothetical protein PHY77_06170 [Desulfotomaculaceae bacterium]|nr:hypothetical protein [Desulfotomaculaceae bacterium]